MTLLWLDNFGYGGTDTVSTGWWLNFSSYYSASGALGTPYLRYPSSRTSTAGYIEFGYRDGFCLHLNSIGDYDEIVYGAAVNFFSGADNFTTFLRFMNASGTHATLGINSSSQGYILNSNGSQVGSTFSVPTSVWFYLEVHLILGNTTGACEVRINGKQKLIATSQDFLYSSGSAYIERIFHYDAVVTQYYLSETYVTDGDFLGPIRVRACFPDEDSATHTDFTPSTGSDHYAMVDETDHDDDSTYNTGSQEGDKDTYLFDTSAIVGPVKGTALLTRAKRTGGSALKFKNMVRISSTDYDGSDEYYTDTDYDNYHQVWEVNPNTSSPWTTGNLSSAEFGVHITGLSTTTTTTTV